MSEICPCVTAKNAVNYNSQIKRVAPFAHRVHIDIGDGVFAPKLVGIDNLKWPLKLVADIHVMYERPADCLNQLIALKPSLVILHAEAEGKFFELAEMLHANQIRVGVALLEHTEVSMIAPSISHIDCVLLFSGNLGHYGGVANLDLLHKVTEIRKLKAEVEIGWDGGINDLNARQLALSGIDTLNVGGFIQEAPSARKAYAKLESVIKGGYGSEH